MNHTKLAAAAAVAFVVAVALLAGASGAPAAKKPKPKPIFPATVSVANGKVTIPRRPLRIVSLSPTATESLFAIGAGSQVVAVDDQSDYPAAAPRTKLSGFRPNAEAVAEYKPDLVIASYDTNRLVDSLRNLGITTLLLPAAKTLDEVYLQIGQLGKATGNRKKATALVASMRLQVAKLKASVKNRGRGLSVYHELSPDHYSATSQTFIGRIYAMFGLTNIADAADTAGTGYPQLSGEYIIATNPTLIFLADTKCCGQTPQTVAARPGWGNIAAVRNGNVVPVNDSVASRWGPRIVGFIRVVAQKILAVRR